MKNIANCRFNITGWDEKPYSEGPDLPKLTRAAVTKTFTGDIAGEGHVEYLMMYGGDGSATFVGLERIVGNVAGKVGSFVLSALEYSRTAWRRSPCRHRRLRHRELRGLRGEGTSAVGHGTEHPFTLNYELVRKCTSGWPQMVCTSERACPPACTPIRSGIMPARDTSRGHGGACRHAQSPGRSSSPSSGGCSWASSTR